MDREPGYDWQRITRVPSHNYLAPAVKEYLASLHATSILDLGCGDGRLTAELHADGLPIQGVDFSPVGIAKAQANFPHVDFRVHDILVPFDDDWKGKFDLVIAVEVIEHLLLPRELFRRAAEVLIPNGNLLVTTPYHGYLKNLALALTGKLDAHFGVDWDYGHVKFFSAKTLTAMAVECGFRPIRLQRVGRIPPLAASMVATFQLR